MKNWKMTTKAIHAGEEELNPEGAHTFPIYQTGTFSFKDLEEATNKIKGKSKGYICSRLGNPNQTLLEKKIAALECGEDALVFASGMAAINAIIQNLAQNGGHVISTQTL